MRRREGKGRKERGIMKRRVVVEGKGDYEGKGGGGNKTAVWDEGERERGRKDGGLGKVVGSGGAEEGSIGKRTHGNEFE